MVSYFIGTPHHLLLRYGAQLNAPYRVVPDFLVQTGDRTGTGGGGESFYGGE